LAYLAREGTEGGWYRSVNFSFTREGTRRGRRLRCVLPGTRLYRQILKAGRKGKLSSFEVGPEFNQLRIWTLDPAVSYDVDFSIIRVNSKLDTGPFAVLGEF
jgi:hypothetical protein